MAAATFTVHTVRVAGQMYINQFTADLGADAGDWFTADEYDAVLLDNIITDESTYTLQKRTTGIYTFQAARPGVSLYLSNQVTPFTGDADVTYTVYAQGLKVKSVTSGGTVQVDHSSDTIDIVGAPVNFNQYMVDIFGALKSERANELTQSIGDANITIDATRARIDSAIAYWQGVTTSAN